jgi:hypothetical protein
MEISACEYYEWGQGYIFTQYGSGIGVVVDESLLNGARSQYYKQLSAIGDLNWDWNSLSQLIQTNCPITTLPDGTGSGNGNSTDSGSGQNSTTGCSAYGNWKNLFISDNTWKGWLVVYEQNSDMESWTQTEWKQWITIYGQFMNAVRLQALSY